MRMTSPTHSPSTQMILAPRGPMPSRNWLRFCIPVLLIAVAAAPSYADTLQLGQAGAFTAFSLGAELTLGTTDTTLLGNTAQIYGDVAVGADTSVATGLAGIGDFQKGFIDGNMVVDGAFAGSPGYATWSLDKNFGVTGTIDGNPSPCTSVVQNCAPGTPATQGQTNLMPAVQDAVSASSYWNSQPGTNLGAVSGSTTLAAGIYYASSFLLNGGAPTLTITGGVNDTFVLNVSGDFTFSKSFIDLDGGITWDNVLFNVTGTGTSAKISGDDSIFFGTLLAVSRDVDIQGIGSHNGSIQGATLGADDIGGTADDNPGLQGRVIGSLSTTLTGPLQLQIYSGAELNGPTGQYPPAAVPEPGSLLLLGSGLAGLGLLGRRKSRKTK